MHNPISFAVAGLSEILYFLSDVSLVLCQWLDGQVRPNRAGRLGINTLWFAAFTCCGVYVTIADAFEPWNAFVIAIQISLWIAIPGLVLLILGAMIKVIERRHMFNYY